MTVTFATYHSLDVISKAQCDHGMPEFDLVICDEAHRTTGQVDTRARSIQLRPRARRRFPAHIEAPLHDGDTAYLHRCAHSKAKKQSSMLCAMDDPKLFGEVFFYRGFDWAIRNGLLSDYRVVILGLDEEQVSESLQRSLSADNEITLDDGVKILGSYKALMKHSVDPSEFADDPAPVRRAMAFSNKIEESTNFRDRFAKVVSDHHASHSPPTKPDWRCEVAHVDGASGASEREAQLRWLREGGSESVCHMLSNVRCLGEGVDVPALDAVLFLRPRQSQIDVVQAVGRVMRKAPGKKRGYVILPIGIPAGVPPEEALKDNEKYRVIWQIVNALKSHDEQLEAQINATSFGEAMPDQKIRITMGNLAETARAGLSSPSTGGGNGGGNGDTPPPPTQGSLPLALAEAVYARMVRRCGAVDYWEDWASDVQKIARDPHHTHSQHNRGSRQA